MSTAESSLPAATAPGGNGHGPPPAAFGALPFGVPATGLAEGPSSYLAYLPAIYGDDPFVGRFLRVFETVLEPIERMVGTLDHYFDPSVAPADLLPWLASWLGLVLDERWPLERRRALVKGATDLYRWRGTRRGLSEFIRLYTGFTPEIVEPTLGELAGNRELAYTFAVVLRIPKDQVPPAELLEAIIEAEKPAFARYRLEVVPT